VVILSYCRDQSHPAPERENVSDLNNKFVHPHLPLGCFYQGWHMKQSVVVLDNGASSIKIGVVNPPANAASVQNAR
jgi:hypothetical protein